MHLSHNLFMRKFFFLAGFLTSFSFAALGQSQLILDGNFESPIFSPPWNASLGVTVPSDAGARSPTHYLSLGHTVGFQSAYQTVVLPTNTVAATLYGVVLDTTGDFDVHATQSKRAALRSERLPDADVLEGTDGQAAVAQPQTFTKDDPFQEYLGIHREGGAADGFTQKRAPRHRLRELLQRIHG